MKRVRSRIGRRLRLACPTAALAMMLSSQAYGQDVLTASSGEASPSTTTPASAIKPSAAQFDAGPVAPEVSGALDEGARAIVEWALPPLIQEWIEAPLLAGVPALPFDLVSEQLGIVRAPALPQDPPDWRRGWWGGRSRPFVIEGVAAIEVAGRRIALDPSRAVALEGDVWLTPDVWLEAFGFEMSWDPSRLQVRSLPDPDLPIWREWRRASAMKRRGRAAKVDERPVVGPGPALLAGHVFDWELGFGDLTSPQGFANGAWTVGWGAELGRGMLTLAPAGSFHAPPDPLRTRAAWSRAFDSRWLEEIEVGTVSAGAVARRGVWGARVTNRPVWRPDGFVTERRWIRAAPGVLADVYLDGNLVAWGETDSSGRLPVELPLRYGTNRLRVESPDAYGGLVGDEALLRVSRSMLPPGAIEYAVDGGLDRLESDLGVAALSVDWGLHRRLSLQAQIDGVLGDPRHEPGAYPGLRLTAAPFDNWLVGAGWHAAEGLVVDLSWLRPDGIGASLVHREMRRHPVLSPGTEIRRTSTFVVVPFEQWGAPIGLDLRSENATWATGVRQDRMGAALVGRAGLWNGIVEYAWIGDLVSARRVEDSVELSVSRSLPEWGRIGAPGGVARASAWLDPRVPAMRGVEVGWIRGLPWLWRLQVDLAGGALWPSPGLRIGYARVGLQAVVDGARASTDLYTAGDSLSWGARAGGSVVLADGDNDGRVDPYPWWEPQLGRGQALVYVDTPDPSIVRAVEVDGRRWTLDDEGVAFVPTLVRGRPVAAALRKDTLRDPRFSPEPGEAVLVIRGHRATRLTVELIATSELEGEAFMRVAGGARRPQAGLPFVLRDAAGKVVRRTRTFSDGLLYLEGVRPGTYVLAPDPESMAELGWRAEPPERTLTIKESQNGDLVTGLDFEVIPIGVQP